MKRKWVSGAWWSSLRWRGNSYSSMTLLLCVRALSILPEIWDEVRLNLDGDKRMAIERVIAKLHMAPNPNSKVANDDIYNVNDTFWKEFGHFQIKTGVYGLCPGRFLLPDALNGHSYLWHGLYSLPYTSVLGFVACCVTSKRLGIGLAERSWADGKKIKDGKRSNLGGISLEKRAIISFLQKWERQLSPKMLLIMTIMISLVMKTWSK